jgi:hypothetical protein
VIVIGIDPGVTTGYAEWDAEVRAFRNVEGLLIHAAMRRVALLQIGGLLSHVVFEDARLRTWYGKSGSYEEDIARLQGAGSVKRDCSIWADFLGDHGIPYKTLSPREKGAKYDAAQFKRLTGWDQWTNEHGRDAGLLVFGTKAMR